MNLIDRTQSASRQHGMAHTIPRTKGILGIYADSLLAIMTQYLEVPETVQLLQVSRCFLETANARSLWQILYKMHNPNWQNSRLHLMIQNQIQDRGSKEVAYKRLYWLHVQRKEEESWHEKILIRTLQRNAVALSNGNIVAGSRSCSKVMMWSGAGVKISTPDLAAYNLGVQRIQVLPRGYVLTASFKGF